MAAQQASKVRESSSPATAATLQVRRNDWDHIKTPTTPMSPQVDSPFTPLPPKPEWTSRASTSTPPTSAEPPPAPDDTPLPDLPEIPQWKRTGAIPLLVPRELAQIIARKERVTAEYHEIARETRRAVHEYEMACIDLRAAESKRKVANGQLELARSGLLGIEYRPGPSNE
ncbi:hypothetical protein EIP86_000474 [Pleurotus ostreatoroseus]|nr:hypothetical protein EIP86_000474 [Pleurotus ostreatoroseus]